MAAIEFYNDDPDRFCSLIDTDRFARLDPVSFRLLAKYYQAYFGAECRNHSFAVTENGKAQIIVPCQAISGNLRNNGTYIQFNCAPDACTRQKSQLVMDTLDRLMKEHGLHSASFRSGIASGTLDLFGDRLMKAGGAPTPLFWSIIDLNQSEADIRKGIRKSYSSLINWGEQALKTVVLDKDNPDRGLYGEIQAFHAHVAGRVTRSQESWNIHFDMIAAGRAELLVGYLDKQLVSAALYIDEGKTTVYGVGIYERSHFDKPLAHFLTWEGIVRAKKRGQTSFVAGDVYPRGTVDAKQYQIGDFKKGFSPSPVVEIGWMLTRQAEGQS